ncbi:hypothetical protein FB45DRAFT_1099486 [Roridomyces roridus]|uniref:Uncharacterized protein n=1 Tax=Roridomyces roridus TaxID=1738132 RepID=A0AAD7CEP8_9AGAR|nr:hypothetical protein FB45DRAFT_1099486 [Roridomyces roridus]
MYKKTTDDRRRGGMANPPLPGPPGLRRMSKLGNRNEYRKVLATIQISEVLIERAETLDIVISIEHHSNDNQRTIMATRDGVMVRNWVRVAPLSDEAGGDGRSEGVRGKEMRTRRLPKSRALQTEPVHGLEIAVIPGRAPGSGIEESDEAGGGGSQGERDADKEAAKEPSSTDGTCTRVRDSRDCKWPRELAIRSHSDAFSSLEERQGAGLRRAMRPAVEGVRGKEMQTRRLPKSRALQTEPVHGLEIAVIVSGHGNLPLGATVMPSQAWKSARERD